MWSAFRSDLQEFVSGVTEDTSNVLSKLDTGLNTASSADSDNYATTPTSSLAVSSATEQEATTEQEKVNDKVDDGTPQENELQDLLQLLLEDPNTFTQPLEEGEDEKIKEFLASFDIESKTEEIAKLLQDDNEEGETEGNLISNPVNTLKQQFETLVPTEVSYPDFWKRYYYRCNIEYIQQHWEDPTIVAIRHQQKLDAQQEQGGAIGTFSSFLGGAVAAVANTMTEEATAATTAAASATPAAGTGDLTAGALSFLSGAAGRPPFVMNTAVSEDDDDDKDDDDDDEELGWDDDDDDDDMDDDDNGNAKEDDDHDEIEFTSMEKLEEQLKQAIEERDQVLQTVELQKKQIETLQQQSQGEGKATASSEEVDALKMQVFEKDSEIAALKASLNDQHFEKSSETMDIATLEGILGKLPKDQLMQLKTKVFPDDGTKSAAQQAEVEKQKQTIQSLEQQLKSLKQSHKQEQETIQSQSKQKIESLNSELKETKQLLETTTKEKEHLENELQSLKEQPPQEAKQDAPPSPGSNDTSSTGVKISTTATPVPTPVPTGTPISTTSTFVSATSTTTKNNDEEVVATRGVIGDEDDDWGDDWGDDDD